MRAGLREKLRYILSVLIDNYRRFVTVGHRGRALATCSETLASTGFESQTAHYNCPFRKGIYTTVNG